MSTKIIFFCFEKFFATTFDVAVVVNTSHQLMNVARARLLAQKQKERERPLVFFFPNKFFKDVSELTKLYLRSAFRLKNVAQVSANARKRNEVKKRVCCPFADLECSQFLFN